MKRSHTSETGSVLGIVLAMILVLGGITTTVMIVAMSRAVGVMTLEARLEGARIGRSYSDLVATSALTNYAADSATQPPPSFSLSNTSVWELNAAHQDVGSSFPAGLLTEPRVASGLDRDLGIPGSLPWSVPFSESLRCQGSLSLSRESPTSATTISSDIPVEATLWRIPFGCVRFSVSAISPVLDFPIIAQGSALVIPATSGSITNLTATQLFQNSLDTKLTAGANPANRINSVYGLNGPNPGFERVFDTTDEPYAGVSTVVIDGTVYLGIDLGNYRGPSAITIRGAAVAQGFVLIGNPDPASSVARNPLSIAVDGPLILAGANVRYVLAATSSSDVRIYSKVQYNAPASEWRITSGAAVNTEWTGHVFVAHNDLTLRTDENWSGKSYLLRGSLHVVGGRLMMGGSNAGTLGSLQIAEPDWSSISGNNPFQANCRHESFVVGLIR